MLASQEYDKKTGLPFMDFKFDQNGSLCNFPVTDVTGEVVRNGNYVFCNACSSTSQKETVVPIGVGDAQNPRR